MANKPYFLKNCVAKLLLSKTSKAGALLTSLHHFDDNTGRTRQKRLDRRSNIVKLLEVIIPHIELETLSWGKFFTNHNGETDFYTRGISYLAKETGLNDRTIVRSMSDLEKCGYIKVIRREAVGKDGDIIRHYSLRTFTKRFFIDLGFKSETVENIISWKRKKNDRKFCENKVSISCKKGLGKLGSVLKRLGKTETKNKTSFYIPYAKNTNVYKAMKPTDAKSLLAKAKHISERMGTSPLEEYRKLLA